MLLKYKTSFFAGILRSLGNVYHLTSDAFCCKMPKYYDHFLSNHEKTCCLKLAFSYLIFSQSPLHSCYSGTLVTQSRSSEINSIHNCQEQNILKINPKNVNADGSEILFLNYHAYYLMLIINGSSILQYIKQYFQFKIRVHIYNTAILLHRRDCHTPMMVQPSSTDVSISMVMAIIYLSHNSPGLKSMQTSARARGSCQPQWSSANV